MTDPSADAFRPTMIEVHARTDSTPTTRTILNDNSAVRIKVGNTMGLPIEICGKNETVVEVPDFFQFPL
jgi:hypothetical protein